MRSVDAAQAGIAATERARRSHCDKQDAPGHEPIRPRTLRSGARYVHFLGQFVADQDIRGRDLDYAKWQEGELRKLMPNDGLGDLPAAWTSQVGHKLTIANDCIRVAKQT